LKGKGSGSRQPEPKSVCGLTHSTRAAHTNNNTKNLTSQTEPPKKSEPFLMTIVDSPPKLHYRGLFTETLLNESQTNYHARSNSRGRGGHFAAMRAERANPHAYRPQPVLQGPNRTVVFLWKNRPPPLQRKHASQESTSMVICAASSTHWDSSLLLKNPSTSINIVDGIFREQSLWWVSQRNLGH